MEQKLRDAAAGLPETALSFEKINIPTTKKQVLLRPIPAIALCLALVLCAGLGTLAYAAEQKEYNAAVVFFDTHSLPMEGLSRAELKAVYRDIITESFTYTKTAQVLESSLAVNRVQGFEILQSDPTPEDVEEVWNLLNAQMYSSDTRTYRIRSEYRQDPTLGFEVHDTSYLEKYDGDTLLWSVPFTEFWFYSFTPVSDGVMVWGQTPTWSSSQTTYAWLAKVDHNGQLRWKKKLDHGFDNASISAVLENGDGSYAVFSRGDFRYFCLSQYSAEGKELLFRKTEVGNSGIWNAARLGDGYIVQLGNTSTGEDAHIVKVDKEGNITDSFSYTAEDAYYFLTDMLEYNGKVYLSAYAVPRLPEESDDAGGRYEIAAILNYLFDNDIWEISSEELTPMVRDNYTATLLVCDPGTGTPQEFYSAEGSLGGKLAISEEGALLWDVESITTTYFSPYTNAFTIGGTCNVFRYSFDSAGTLISQEKTEELTHYWR